MSCLPKWKYSWIWHWSFPTQSMGSCFLWIYMFEIKTVKTGKKNYPYTSEVFSKARFSLRNDTSVACHAMLWIYSYINFFLLTDSKGVWTLTSNCEMLRTLSNSYHYFSFLKCINNNIQRTHYNFSNPNSVFHNEQELPWGQYGSQDGDFLIACLKMIRNKEYKAQGLEEFPPNR